MINELRTVKLFKIKQPISSSGFRFKSGHLNLVILYNGLICQLSVTIEELKIF